MSGVRFQKFTDCKSWHTLSEPRACVGEGAKAETERERWYNACVGYYESEVDGGHLQADFSIFKSHLPDLVSTMMALAQHLKEASTAPIAVVSVGSRVRWVVRRSSSNICLWYMAASASRAI